MKTITTILLAHITAQVNAQYFTETYLQDQTDVLVKEEAEAIAFVLAEQAAMDEAVNSMKEAERQKEYEEAMERGEATAPDGTVIIENELISQGIREIDPRTPVGFGNPLVRVSEVETSVFQVAMDSGISESDLEEIEEMLEAGEAPVFNATSQHMMFIHLTPRSMCGIDLDHAQNWCGPTCDPNLPFCVMGAVNGVDGYVQTVDSEGRYINWGLCYEDAVCLDESKHELLVGNQHDCETKAANNPCPNTCDCFKSKVKQSQCHEFCKRTDSLGVIQCKMLQEAGRRRRERKVGNELDLAKPCNYNVFYEHPMMYNSILEKRALPGLFETF